MGVQDQTHMLDMQDGQNFDEPHGSLRATQGNLNYDNISASGSIVGGVKKIKGGQVTAQDPN